MKTDPRPFHEREYARACRENLDFFLTERSCPFHTPEQDFWNTAAPGDIDSVVLFILQLVDNDVGADRVEHFKFALKCLKYPFPVNTTALGKKTSSGQHVIPFLMWLIYLLVYEDTQQMKSDKSENKGRLLYLQTKALYQDFLRGVELYELKTAGRFLYPSPLSKEQVHIANTRLQDLKYAVSKRKGELQQYTATKQSFIATLRDLKRRKIAALERLDTAPSRISIQKRLYGGLQNSLKDYRKKLNISVDRQTQNRPMLKQVESESDSLVNTESSISIYSAPLADLKESLEKQHEEYVGLLATLGLPWSRRGVLNEGKLLQVSENFGRCEKENSENFREFRALLESELLRIRARNDATLDRLRNTESTVHLNSAVKDNQISECVSLEKQLHKADVHYQQERQRRDDEIQGIVQNLREIEKKVQLITHDANPSHVSTVIERLQSGYDEASRLFSHEKATIQGSLLIALDLLMLHKQRNHELLNNWSLHTDSAGTV